jgi:hypothetical protein
MRFWIDVETPAGVVQGDGPIATATQWRHIARLDRAGEIAFTMSARDPRAALVVDYPKRIVRCKGQLYPGAAVIDLGAGLVEAWSLKPDKNGDTQLTVSGGDLLRELTHRSGVAPDRRLADHAGAGLVLLGAWMHGMSLDDWTGEGIWGEVVTTGPLYGRAAPSRDAPAVIIWAAGERLTRWCEAGDWVLVQAAPLPGARAERMAAWSHRDYLQAA